MKKIYGVGINDYDGRVNFNVNGKNKMLRSYVVWHGMLKRCYSEKAQEKNPTYKGCSVSKEWLTYSKFKKWYDKNFPFELSEEIKFELDKDLLVEGNKIYSDKNCIFLPHRINSFLINKYSNNKTGSIGVHFNKKDKRFRSRIRDFMTNKDIHLGNFYNLDEAINARIEARKYMALLAKDYMRELNIYPEEIIDKIK